MAPINNIWRSIVSQLKPSEPAFLTGRVDAYYERAKDPRTGGHFVEGLAPGSGDIQLVSNDYLSIADHPEIRKARIEAIQENDNEMLRSGVFRFGDTPQGLFEKEMAEWLSAESSLLCQSGWCANVGLVQSLATPEVPVYLDMMAHMSLWEGVKSAGATPHPFRHNTPESLEKLVQKHGPGVILVDSLYSTSGTFCPLADIVEISEKNGCILVVDESHSLGIMGEHGEGLVSEMGLADRVQFRTASLSKTFAGRGGIIIGSVRHIEYVKYESFPSIFSSGVHDYDIAGFRVALGIIKQANAKRADLQVKADFLRQRLSDAGYDMSASQSQIMSLVAGPEAETIRLRDALEIRGIFGSPFCAPATPKNRSLIRFSVNVRHTEAELSKVADVCRDIREIVQADQWQSASKKNRTRPKARFLVPEPSIAM